MIKVVDEPFDTNVIFGEQSATAGGGPLLAMPFLQKMGVHIVQTTLR